MNFEAQKQSQNRRINKTNKSEENLRKEGHGQFNIRKSILHTYISLIFIGKHNKILIIYFIKYPNKLKTLHIYPYIYV